VCNIPNNGNGSVERKIMKINETSDIQVEFKVPKSFKLAPVLVRKIESEAKRTRRTMTSIVEECLEAHFFALAGM
jgi:hypothetical protein